MRLGSIVASLFVFALTGCATIFGISEGNPDPNNIMDEPSRDGGARDGTLTPEQGGDPLGTSDGGGKPLDACAPCPGESQCTDLNTNARNCGRCGHDCRGSKCTLGACEPTVIAGDQNNPVDLAVDNQRVYWVNNGSPAQAYADGAARHCTKTGCTTPMSVPATAPTGVATDGTSMFYTSAANGGSIMTCPSNNCAAATALATSQPNAFGVVVDATHVIFSLRNVGGSGASIRYVPKVGGGVSVFNNGGVGFFDATFLHLHQASARVYFTQTSQGLIGRCGTDGVCTENGAFASIGTTSAPTGVFFDGARAYYTQGTAISSVTPGQSDFQMFATQAAAHSIVIDGTDVYWSQNDGTIMACPKSGMCTADKRLVLARSQINPTRIAVDKDFVYWVNSWPTSGAVMKVPR